MRGLDNLADTAYIMDMTNETTTRATRPVCSYYECRKTATHVMTGSQIFCADHAAEMAAGMLSSTWTVREATRDELVAIYNATRSIRRQ